LSENPNDPTPPNRPDAERRGSRLIVTHAFFEGPLPPPALLEQFERLVPGAASRILAFTEDEFRHRRALEVTIVSANTRALGRGQWFGFVVMVAGLGLGAWLVRGGDKLIGFASIIAPLTTAAALFVYAQRREERERERKRAEYFRG
jgi:uncharacterized membrane protein